MGEIYDTIGQGYARKRRPDSRIAAQVHASLGDAQTILNVGAGAGAYEPPDRAVTALEPSLEMIAQRRASKAAIVQGHAESLPFETDSFDASMAVLTVHHWHDQAKGMAELQRVTRGPIVILTFDPAFRGFWLTDYLPDLIALDENQMPAMEQYAAWLGPVAVTPIPIPHDCTDGFLAAYWRRPHAYLDADTRAAISPLRMLGDITAPLKRLETDLVNGTWADRYGHLRTCKTLDCGYRLVVARG